jgi:hypothetical protein
MIEIRVKIHKHLERDFNWRISELFKPFDKKGGLLLSGRPGVVVCHRLSWIIIIWPFKISTKDNSKIEAA